MTWRGEGERGEGERGEGQPAREQPRHPPPRRLVPRMAGRARWAELHCHSSFSFLDGAATPGELVAEAARLGLEVLALTAHDGMYGVPQFAQAAAKLGDRGARLGTVFGAELSLPGGNGGRVAPPYAGGPGGSSPRTQSAVTC